MPSIRVARLVATRVGAGPRGVQYQDRKGSHNGGDALKTCPRCGYERPVRIGRTGLCQDCRSSDKVYAAMIDSEARRTEK